MSTAGTVIYGFVLFAIVGVFMNGAAVYVYSDKPNYKIVLVLVNALGLLLLAFVVVFFVSLDILAADEFVGIVVGYVMGAIAPHLVWRWQHST